MQRMSRAAIHCLYFVVLLLACERLDFASKPECLQTIDCNGGRVCRDRVCQQVAFVGAEGFGTETAGGRAGELVFVDRLEDDSNPGSLRHALEVATGPRTVVFRVGGTLALESPLSITEAGSFVTVAGQTAPGGIQLKNYGIEIKGGAHDVVLRHLRIRPGQEQSPAATIQVYGILIWSSTEDPVHHIVIDHCSVAWAGAANISIAGRVHDVTVQWSIIAESNTASAMVGQSAGSTGLSLANNSATTQTVSLHHNLFAHNGNLNPGASTTVSIPELASLFDVRNNVFYNWTNNNYGQFTSTASVDDVGRGPHVNLVGNQYRRGPDGLASDANVVFIGGSARLYVEDNIGPACAAGCVEPWDIGVKELPDNFPADPMIFRSATMFVVPAVATDPATSNFARVLATAGAASPIRMGGSSRRDVYDERIVGEVENLAGQVGPSGEYPVLSPVSAPEDLDEDGMCDDWENKNGLDSTNPLDFRDDRDGDGYTNLEEYLQRLADETLGAGSTCVVQ
ncbi:MAG: hypothetical protein R3C68_19480 [Myxococcota bacterium]